MNCRPKTRCRCSGVDSRASSADCGAQMPALPTAITVADADRLRHRGDEAEREHADRPR